MDNWSAPVIRRATYNGIHAADMRVIWHRSLLGDHSETLLWSGLGIF
jgi:hypothetical protein